MSGVFPFPLNSAWFEYLQTRGNQTITRADAKVKKLVRGGIPVRRSFLLVESWVCWRADLRSCPSLLSHLGQVSNADLDGDDQGLGGAADEVSRQ